MIPWIIIAVGVLLLYSSLKEGAKAWPSAAGAIVIGIGVVALGKSFGWLAIGAGVLGLMFLLIGLKAVTRLLAGAALIGMVLGGIVSIDLDDDDKTEASADDTPATTTTTAGGKGGCAAVQLDPNEGNRVISTGLNTPDTEEIRQQVLDLNWRDPNALFLYYNASPLGSTSPLTSVQELVDGDVENGSCYSAKGIRAYDEWSVLWKVARLTPVDSMPPGWSNTGVSDGGPTVGTPPSGDTSGVMVEFPNSDIKHGVMDRCGNPVVASPPPNVPPGPTDEPPPPGEGKDHTESPVSDDRNDPDERVRPNIDAPPEVIRPPGSTTTQPPPPSTLPEDPPEVSDPEPIEPGVEDEPPTDDDPVEDGPCGDADGDGIPDDC
jgi:hypothetical protein